MAGILDDARSARAWLAQRTGVRESDIVLMGRSLGGAVAIQLAGDVPPRGLIVESTFASLKEIAGFHFPRLAWLVPAGELQSSATLAKYAGPLLHSHGDADRVIPFAQGEQLYAKATGRKQFFRIAGGDHNDPQPDEYYRRLNQFLADLPPPAPLAR
ncbi:MAG: alpha/beta hydrolase [Pirellulales bacterium]